MFETINRVQNYAHKLSIQGKVSMKLYTEIMTVTSKLKKAIDPNFGK